MLTATRVRELFRYEPETGVFTRLISRGKGKAGDVIAGFRKDGYQIIRVDGEKILGHRLAWLYAHGRWPKQDIDHIDGNPSNNALANLRDVPRSVNISNQSRPRTNTTSGHLGVAVVKSRGFIAQVVVRGVHHHLGVYPTAIEASRVYQRVKASLLAA